MPLSPAFIIWRLSRSRACQGCATRVALALTSSSTRLLTSSLQRTVFSQAPSRNLCHLGGREPRTGLLRFLFSARKTQDSQGVFIQRIFQRTYSTAELNIAKNPLLTNTNVLNNVMLFRYEKDFLMRGAVAFAIFGLVGCASMAYNVYDILCHDLWNPNIPLKTRLKDHIYQLVAISIGLLAGPLLMICTNALIIRTIKYVILHKGGKTVTIVTYHPIFQHKKIQIPIENVNCLMNRFESKSYAVISLKGNKRRYMIDKSGHFVNSDLFDSIMSVSRQW